MEVSETIKLLKEKILKIFSFLLLIRLGLYIPVPNVDLDIFSQNQVANPLFGLAKNLTGSSFLGIGSLGILPYINSSIVIQLLTPVIPSLERLQKEEGELGRQQITRYTNTCQTTYKGKHKSFTISLELINSGISFDTEFALLLFKLNFHICKTGFILDKIVYFGLWQ